MLVTFGALTPEKRIVVKLEQLEKAYAIVVQGDKLTFDRSIVWRFLEFLNVKDKPVQLKEGKRICDTLEFENALARDVFDMLVLDISTTRELLFVTLNALFIPVIFIPS